MLCVHILLFILSFAVFYILSYASRTTSSSDINSIIAAKNISSIWDPTFDPRLLFQRLPHPSDTTPATTSHHHSTIFDFQCTIPRFHARELSPQKFFQEFKSKNLPVVLDFGSSHNLEFKNLCQKSIILQKQGHTNVLLSSADTFSYEKRLVPFREYVEQLRPIDDSVLGKDTFYHFGDHDLDDWGDFFQGYQKPIPYLTESDRFAYSFGVGSSGSGVPFHTHGDGFSEVFHGKKRWFLFIPENIPDLPQFHDNAERMSFFDPKESILQWFFMTYPHLDFPYLPQECIIEPGQVLYFPSAMYHAVLNIGETVFMSTFL